MAWLLKEKHVYIVLCSTSRAWRKPIVDMVKCQLLFPKERCRESSFSFLLPLGKNETLRPLLPAVSCIFSAEEKVSQHLSGYGEERPRTNGDLNIYTCGKAPPQARKGFDLLVPFWPFV